MANREKFIEGVKRGGLFQGKKENMSCGGQGLPISANLNTREELAKIAGVSHDTIHKVETIEREVKNLISYHRYVKNDLKRLIIFLQVILYLF